MTQLFACQNICQLFLLLVCSYLWITIGDGIHDCNSTACVCIVNALDGHISLPVMWQLSHSMFGTPMLYGWCNTVCDARYAEHVGEHVQSCFQLTSCCNTLHCVLWSSTSQHSFITKFNTLYCIVGQAKSHGAMSVWCNTLLWVPCSKLSSVLCNLRHASNRPNYSWIETLHTFKCWWADKAFVSET